MGMYCFVNIISSNVFLGSLISSYVAPFCCSFLHKLIVVRTSTLISVYFYYGLSLMAEKAAFTASDALKQLEQQLTCPVCLERYTHPRTLPCLHGFCHQCLGHFPVVVEQARRKQILIGQAAKRTARSAVKNFKVINYS